MRFVQRRTLAIIVTAMPLVASGAGAQTTAPVNPYQGTHPLTLSNGAVQRTGKERLGEKWKDEQRIDNCKVPLDKRGIKWRPDSCAHVP